MAVNPKWAIEAGAGIVGLVTPLVFPAIPIWGAVIVYLIAAGLIGYAGGKMLLNWRATKKQPALLPVEPHLIISEQTTERKGRHLVDHSKPPQP